MNITIADKIIIQNKQLGVKKVLLIDVLTVMCRSV